MSEERDVEGCGRCATSTVVDATGIDADPYEGGHIEVDEREARTASAHVVAAGRVKSWLNGLGRRLTYGR